MMVEVRKKSPLRERLTKRQLEVRDEEDVLLKLVKILADEARPRPNAVPKRLSSRWIYVAWSVMFIYYVFCICWVSIWVLEASNRVNSTFVDNGVDNATETMVANGVNIVLSSWVASAFLGMAIGYIASDPVIIIIKFGLSPLFIRIYSRFKKEELDKIEEKVEEKVRGKSMARSKKVDEADVVIEDIAGEDDDDDAEDGNEQEEGDQVDSSNINKPKRAKVVENQATAKKEQDSPLNEENDAPETWWAWTKRRVLRINPKQQQQKKKKKIAVNDDEAMNQDVAGALDLAVEVVQALLH